MTTTPPGLGPGERAPDFVAPDETGAMVRFYARAGGRPALVLFGSDLTDAVAQALQHLGQVASVHAVLSGGSSAAPIEGADVFVDDGVARKAFRLPADDGTYAVLFDRNLRALASRGLDDDGWTDLVAALPTAGAAERTITSQAPVLFIPRILEPALCRHLQQVWEQDHADTGVERSEDATRQDVLAADAKKRRDHVVSDQGLMKALTQTVGRRVLPEVRRLCHYNADRFEGFKIACYDADSGGFFDAHRDNLSPATAHRRFALSVNLNDDYEGGELRFPEYGDERYRPAAGEGLMFPCSMLHEVVPVTQGRRYTLLTFLFGADAVRSSGPASS